MKLRINLEKQMTLICIKKYCQLRNLVQRETRISKRDYLTNKIEENVGNSKKLWDQLKKTWV